MKPKNTCRFCILIPNTEPLNVQVNLRDVEGAIAMLQRTREGAVPGLLLGWAVVLVAERTVNRGPCSSNSKMKWAVVISGLLGTGPFHPKQVCNHLCA